MTNFNESIDTTVFMTLQISKKCLEMGLNRPPLYLSGPGLGKTTAVELFAEVNGYDMVTLRISNETPDTITGYDVVGGNQEAVVTSAKHIRPSWFQKILDNKERGIKSVLFLDELTTADTYVQGAALNLVFDRRCHAEKLPEDTLICAAGNYANNLSNEMQVLAPMLNRFMIVNIIPKEKDLTHFLCKYEGSLAGNRMDFHDEIKKAMTNLKNQEKVDLDEKLINSVGEYIQQAILTETRQQIREGVLKLEISELKDIYSDQSNDEPVPNFYSFRSANYLLDAAVACYICFGKAGLMSDNFKNIINGTVGLALSRDSQGNIKKTNVTDRYYEAICETATDIEKMFNDKLPEYQDYFNDIVNKYSTDKPMTVADMNAIKNKLTEMMGDKDIQQIERPLSKDLMIRMCESISSTVKKSVSYKFSSLQGDVKQSLEDNQEDYVARINTWNTLTELYGGVFKLLLAPEKKYDIETKNLANKVMTDLRQCCNTLKTLKRSADKFNPAISKIFPEIKPIVQ